MKQSYLCIIKVIGCSRVKIVDETLHHHTPPQHFCFILALQTKWRKINIYDDDFVDTVYKQQWVNLIIPLRKLSECHHLLLLVWSHNSMGKNLLDRFTHPPHPPYAMN